MHNGAGLGVHAREELNARAPEGRVEGEADARRRESPGVPHLILVGGRRVRRQRLPWPPPERFGCDAGRENFNLFGGGFLGLASHAEHFVKWGGRVFVLGMVGLGWGSCLLSRWWCGWAFFVDDKDVGYIVNEMSVVDAVFFESLYS